MIIFMSTKQWKKNCKKLVKPKEYVVLDCTGAEKETSKVYGHYNNVVQLEGFSIPPKAKKFVKKIGIVRDKDSILYDDEEALDNYQDMIDDLFLIHADKLDKYFMNYWTKELAPMDAIYAILMAQLEGTNMGQVFVVLKPKDYEIFSRYIVRAFNTIMEKDYGKNNHERRDYGIVFEFKDWKDDPDMFAKPLKDHQMSILKKVTDRLKEDYCDFDIDRYREKVAAEQRKKASRRDDD